MTDEEKADEYSTENWEYYEEGQNDSKARKLSAFAELLQNQNEIVNPDTIRTIGSMIDDSARKIKGITENENV